MAGGTVKMRLSILVFVVSALCVCQCSKNTDCTNMNNSTQYLAKVLESYSEILEMNEPSSKKMDRIVQWHLRHEGQIEACAAVVTETLRTMPREDVMRHHQAFIADVRVNRFLDAQDTFNETATTEEIERLDELLAELFLLSE